MKTKLEDLGYIIRIAIHDGIWFECDNLPDDLLDIIKTTIKNKLKLDIPLDYEDTAPTEDDLKWFEGHRQFYFKTKDMSEHLTTLRTDQIYSNNLLSVFKDKAFSIRADDGSNLIMYDSSTTITIPDGFYTTSLNYYLQQWIIVVDEAALD